MKRFSLLLFCLLVLSPELWAQEEEFSFNADKFEPKAFEFTGYIEAEPEYASANKDGALYQLQFFDHKPESTLDQFTGTLELEGHYRKNFVSAHFQTHSEITWDHQGKDQDNELYEGYLGLQRTPEFMLNLGKKAMRWGKGYAWNPVAFVERAKDAGDPDLAREGYWIAAADWIKSFEGSLQTLALTALVLPVSSDVNSEFGELNHTNLSAKLYLLYRDIDIDFMFLSEGSRGMQVGMDFSKNLAPNFEIHGEFAYFEDVTHIKINDDCKSEKFVDDEISYLFGLRHRFSDRTTLIWEYYFNGRGNKKSEQKQFYRCVHEAWESGDQDLINKLPLNDDLDKGPFTKPNPMRKYMNFRVWWEEPWDFIYLTTGLQVLHNLEDGSYSVTTDMTYDGFKDVVLFLRGTVPVGDTLTEWGEKPNEYKIEARIRYFF